MHLDHLIVLLFLLIHLLVGIRSIRHPSIQHTSFNRANIIAAVLTIMYGGKVLCHPLYIGDLIRFTGHAISYFIIGTLLARRLHLFLSNGSVAAVMGRLYGHSIRKIVALCGILHSTGIAALQIKLLSMGIAWFFGMQANYSLVIAAVFLTFGIGSNNVGLLRLVRIIRCTTFGILLPIIAWTVWKGMVSEYNGDQAALTLAIKRSWNSLIHLQATPLECMAYFILFAIPGLYPSELAAIVLSQNATQTKRSFNGAGFFALSITLLLLWVTLLVQKDPSQWMLSTLPFNTFGTYLGLQALYMLGLAAFTMSTSSTNLHTATILMTNDLPGLFKWVKRPILYQVILSAIATLLALYTNEETIWLAIMLFKTVITIPVLLSLIGMALDPHAVFMGMLTSGLTTIAWFCFGSNKGMNGLLPAMGINLLTIMAIQIFKGKHQTNLYQENPILAQNVRKTPPLWKQLYKYILNSINKFSLWNYLEKQLPKDHSIYILFSFYILLTGYGSFYTFSSNPAWHAKLEAFILLPSLFVVAFFLVYLSIVPQSYVRKIASVIWPLSHIYFLFLVGTSMTILSHFAHLHNIIFMINLTLSIFMTPWIVIWFGCIISAMMVWTISHYMDGSSTCIDYCLDLNTSIGYAVSMLFVLVGGLLYHKKGLDKLLSIIEALTCEQEEQNARQIFNKQQVEALAYENNCIISQLNKQLMRLETSDERMLAYSEQSIKLKKYCNSIFNHLKDNLHLVTNWTRIDQLLAECFDAIKMNSIYNAPYVMTDTKQIYIQCAIESIKNLIINSLYTCSRHKSLHNHQKNDIYIYIDETQLGYRLTLLEGRFQKINAIRFVITTSTELPPIHPIYKVAEMADIQLLDDNQEKIDAQSNHIVHAHYGYHERFCSGSNITHLYVIPVNVKEVTKAFAMLSPVVHTQKMILDPVSMKEEAAFLEKVNQKKGLNVDTVMDALELIKLYYATQRRKTGELFYLHPMAVADILLNITDNAKVIIAGLVHDVVQNTPLTEAGLTTLFGTSVTKIVLAAANLEKELCRSNDAYTTYIKRIINDKNHDAILVRLADVLHNARTIAGHTVEKQIQKAKLIRKFYLPLAREMQLHDISDELQLHTEKILHIAIVKR